MTETSITGQEVEPTGDEAIEVTDLDEDVKELKRKVGRPMESSDKIDEAQKVLVLSISGGNYIETACDLAKISQQTFYYWYRKGLQHPGGRYGEFVVAIDEAKAKAENRNVALVNRAAEKEWTAAAWWLERTRPKKWGKKDMQQIEANVNATVKIEYVDDWNKKNVEE